MAFNPPRDQWLSETERLDDIFGPMPELPPPSTQIRTPQGKTAVVEAVRGGWVPIEEVCQSYMISVDEFLSWERDVDRLVTHGQRRTHCQLHQIK